MSNLVEVQPLQIYPQPQPQAYPIVMAQPHPIQYVQVQPNQSQQAIVYDDFRERFLGKAAAFLFGGVCLIGVGYAIAPKPSATATPTPIPTPVATPSAPPVVVIDGGKAQGCQILCFGK